MLLSDAAVVAALLGELEYPAHESATARRIEELGRDERAEGLVAEVEGVVVGFATLLWMPMFHRDGGILRIMAFVVATPHRRRGVGRALMVACLAVAQERGAERMELTTGDRRAEAHAFYAEQGFEREGIRMTRWLAPRR